MNEHFGGWWQSLVAVGAPIFPYVGLVLLIVLGILVLFVILYWMYKLAKRLPPILRYSLWRLSTLMKRLTSLKPKVRPQQLTALFAGEHTSVAFDASFGRLFGLLVGRRRPPLPLFIVLGSPDSGASSLLRLASGRGDADTTGDPNAVQADVVWWQLEGRLALEVHPHLNAPSAHAQRMHLLHVLERFSPAQPLDGIIVTLSARLLLEKNDEQRKEMAQLGRVVTEFCAVSGGRLPVYVVISGSEYLTGFRRLAQTASGRFLENELHWLGASPAIAPDVEEALTMWCQSVEDAVLRSLVVAQPRDAVECGNSVLALPAQIVQLQSPLLEWLKGITATGSRDQSAAAFGGVLLTGLTQPEHKGMLASSWGLRTLALNLNFAKVAPSQPVARYVLRMRRRLGVAAIVLLGSLLLLALWMPHIVASIQGDVKNLRAVVGNSANFQHESLIIGGVHAASQDPERLDRLLNAIAVTAKSSMRAALAPTSWFDGSRSLLLSALGASAQKLLIEPRVEALAQDRISLPAEAFLVVRGVSSEKINGLPAYGVLQEFLSSRELVGSAKDTAESLAGGVTYEDMVRFLGDDPARFRSPLWDRQSTLPAEVTERFDISGLNRGDPAHQDVKSLVDSLWERLLQESLDFHPAVVLTQEINVLSDRLARDPTWSYDDAVSLGNRLKRLQQEIEKPQAQRLLGTMPDALRFFSPAFVRLSSSSIVPMPQRTEASAEFGRRREAVRSRLMSYEPDGIGRVFVLDAASDTLKMSAEVKRFTASYGLLMAQPFMRQAVATTVTGVQTDRALSWNLAQLESVKELSTAYRDYAATGIQTFDTILRSNLLRITRFQFRRVVDSVVLQSVRPPDRIDRSGIAGEPLIALREQAENLAAAARLYKLAVSLDDETVPGVGAELLAGQLVRVLNDLESRLVIENPYESLVTDTQRWVLSSVGDRPLASVMRGSPKERIMLARDYIRTQYGVAAGLLLQGLNGLSPGSARDEIVQRWRRLADTLNDFDKGASANGLYELEQYILNLAKLGEPNDCVRFLAERAPVLWRSDYFSARLAQLDEKMQDACAQRTLASKQKNYLLFAKWFNSQVAGHAPFSDDRRMTPLTRRSFAAVLDRYRDMRKNISAVPPEWPQSVAQFLEQMDGLSMRFASLESGKTTAGGATIPQNPNALQAKLQFRTNGTEAVLADQIIDWIVVAGSRQYGLRNTKDLFEWRIGEAIEVRLRWAANSPYTPVASKNGNDFHTVEGRSVVFRFPGEWAFFDLLHRHRARGDGFEKIALRFAVPVVGPEGRMTTHVFLTLSTPDDQASLAWSFPIYAPVLPTESASGADSAKRLDSRP